MKKYLIRRIIFFFGISIIFGSTPKCYAAKFLNITAHVKNKTTVELRWKKNSVTKYEIYRFRSNNDSDTGKYKKIATISGSKTKYVDKDIAYKKYYNYRIKACKKKKQKKSTILQGDVIVYTGMAIPLWDDYLFADSETTPTSIQLAGYTDGLLPSGFEIYRKTETSKYKKIKTIKSKKLHFIYVDKTVKKGQKYTYKYRAFRKVKRKKIFSKYSDSIQLSSVNREATFSMENLTKEGLTNVITVKLTSLMGNGKASLENNINHITYRHEETDGESDYWDMTIVAYSYDNVTWNTFPKKDIIFTENQTIYLQFARIDGKSFTYSPANSTSATIEWWTTYNDRHSILWIDLLKKTAKATVNGEYYH